MFWCLANIIVVVWNNTVSMGVAILPPMPRRRCAAGVIPPNIQALGWCPAAVTWSTHSKCSLLNRRARVHHHTNPQMRAVYYSCAYCLFIAASPNPAAMCEQQGWRRPWDGMDGDDFRDWAKGIKCIAADRHERPENVVSTCVARAVPMPKKILVHPNLWFYTSASPSLWVLLKLDRKYYTII